MGMWTVQPVGATGALMNQLTERSICQHLGKARTCRNILAQLAFAERKQSDAVAVVKFDVHHIRIAHARFDQRLQAGPAQRDGQQFRRVTDVKGQQIGNRIRMGIRQRAGDARILDFRGADERVGRTILLGTHDQESDDQKYRCGDQRKANRNAELPQPDKAGETVSH